MAVDEVTFYQFGEDFEDAGLVFGVEGEVGVFVVAEDAEALEGVGLEFDVFHGVVVALFADFVLGEFAEFWAEGFLDGGFDGEAVAIPAGDVGGIVALHGAEFDDDVFEDFVDEVAHVDVAVGVGGAVVEDPFAFGVLARADLLVEFLVLPLFDHGGFARGEVGFHVEVGFGEVEGVFIVGGGGFGGHGDFPI